MAKHPGRKNKTNGDPPRFDLATLREIAGDKVFARGVEYHKDGQVEIVAIDGARVLARVIGSEVYRSQLTGTGREFSGECTCPAFSDWGFCKHLVATALAANALAPGAAVETANRLSAIRECLRAKGANSLIDMILALAERDSTLFRELELAAAAASADEPTLFAQFKKAITDATRTGGYIEYGEARDWADTVERLLDRIEDLIAAGRAKLALRLLDHFFVRMATALASMDDSDGAGGAVYAKACETHLAACREARPDPIALARELFVRETDSDWDFFHGASEAYSDVLGKAGLAEYRRLASEAWQAIKPRRPGGTQAADEEFGARYQLGAILESFAAREGDLDARIVIRSKDLSSAYHYLGIAALCLEHGRKGEATKWAEEGLWQFEDHPDERLVFFTADLYRRTGREQDAHELLWRTFEQLPNIELYQRLKTAAGSGKAAVDAISDRAVALLRAKLNGSRPKMQWWSPSQLLVEILALEQRRSEAWDVVRDHGCNEAQLLILAKAREQSHPSEALSAYAQRAERLATLGGQPNYEEANKLIGRMQSIRKRIGTTTEHATFLAGFMSRHKAKRNLMKLLQVKK